MNNLITLFLLSIASIIFLIIIRKKGKRSETLAFLSTMIATLFGVLLAITLSNNATDKKEKSDTIKLLRSANNIISKTYDYAIGLEAHINKQKKDSINYNDSVLRVLKDNNPIPYPDLMETVISNELISRNLTEFSHNEVYNMLINLRKTSNYNALGTYKLLLKELSLLLDLEMEFQKGNLTLEKLTKKFNTGRDDLANKFPYSIGAEVIIDED